MEIQMRQVLSRMVLTYKKILAEHPLKVQSVQAAILMGAGDVIAQGIIEKDQKDYDYYRTLRFTFLGSTIGPSLYIWYSILDRFIGKSVKPNVKTSSFRLETPLLKVAVDQGIFAPLFLAVFITSNSLLEGKSIDEVKHRLKEDYPDILVANYKVWPAVQILNFSLIPLQYRVLFLQTIALAWNTYLAWRLNFIKTDTRQ